MNFPTPSSLNRHGDNTSPFRPGDIVVANVRNPIENRDSQGKRRPFMLVQRVDGHWRGMGFTTNPCYADLSPRVTLPNPAAIGLRSPGFLWSDHLTNVSVLDIYRVIGRADTELAELVVARVRLDAASALGLRESVLTRSDAPDDRGCARADFGLAS